MIYKCESEGSRFLAILQTTSSRLLFIKGVKVVTGSLRKNGELGLFFFFFRYSFEIFTKKSDFLALCFDELLT